MHANVERLDCPRLNCSRKGDNGFTRRDHLTEHLRYYHGYEYSQKPARADTPFEAKLPEPLSEISDEDIDKVVKCSRLQCRNVFLKRHDFTKHVQSHIDSNLERAKGKSPDTRKGDCMEPFSETLLGNADKSTSDSAMSQEPHRMLTVSPDENSGNVGYSTIRRHFAKLSVESKSNLRLSHPSPSINGGSEVVRNQEDLSRELVNRNLCGTAETELVDPTGGAASTRSYKRQYENPMPDTGVARVPAQYVDSRNTVTTREFDVLPRDDKTMTAWKLILSSIRRQYSEIMGPQNMGSVELLALGDKPTICVTCQYPERLRRSKLEEIISPLGFPYQIGAGYINRSGGDGFVPHLAGNFFPETTESCNQLARAFQSGPALYGHYMLRPDCGASIGVHGLAALEAARVSLGGYVELRFGERWERYALTSHHLLHIDDEATGSTDDHGDRSTAFESFQETTPGVCNGIYTLDATSITVDIRSSAKTDHENELSRLMERSRWIGNNRRYGNVESGNLIKAVQSLTNSPSRFGRAIYSSGLCIEEELELQVRVSLPLVPL